jgi:hypothetical protein
MRFTDKQVKAIYDNSPLTQEDCLGWYSGSHQELCSYEGRYMLRRLVERSLYNRNILSKDFGRYEEVVVTSERDDQ